MTDKPKATTSNADSRTDRHGNPSPIPQLLRPPRSNNPEPARPVLPPWDSSFDNQPPRELYRPEPVPPAEVMPLPSKYISHNQHTQKPN